MARPTPQPTSRPTQPPALTRVWTPGRPVDLLATLGTLRRGGRDPSFWVDRLEDGGVGAVWWATSTPDGDGTLRLTISRERADDHHSAVQATAWGAGAEWLLDGVPTLLGSGDTTHQEFEPVHAQVTGAWRRVPGWRVPQTRRPFEACVASVIEQKVTGVEARSSWRQLVQRFGVAAPGPMAALRVPPTPAVWRDLPDWEYQRAGVTPQRVRTLRVVAAAASAIERTAQASSSEADAVLRALPGIGVWTSAEVRQRSHGDADAVSFGDYHVAKQLCWWLTGVPGDDARLEVVLHEYAGHRYRVQRLMELSGAHMPRRGPRMSIPTHRR